MERPKCVVEGCKKGALLLFGSNWICGDCYMKIKNKQTEAQNKLIEEIGVTG